MAALDAELPAGDGLRYFNALYLAATTEVIEALRADRLEDPAFLEHLAVLLSEAYFRAADRRNDSAAGGSHAWAALIEARHDRRVAPIQFALAGLGAHVGYDVPLGIVDACGALGLVPRDGSPQHRDYLRLNAILDDVLARVKGWLFPSLLGCLDRSLGRLDDVVASFSVERARDGAWAQGKGLWRLREDPEVMEGYVAALDRTVGLACRGLVIPTLLGVSGWAAAQTWLPAAAKPLFGAPGSAALPA